MRLAEIVETSRALRGTRSRREKVERLAACLRRLRPEEVRAGVAWLAGRLPQGRIGLGPAAVRDALGGGCAPAGGDPSVLEVDEAFSRMAALRGPGSGRERARQLASLLARAGPDERDFLARLALGELRQGASEGLVVEAVAAAAGAAPETVRRAVMLAGDPAPVAEAVLARGPGGLAGFSLRLFQPVLPMFAQPAEDPEEALRRLGGEAGFEWKLDGARIQVHAAGGDVRVYSRRAHDITAAVPEVAEATRGLGVRELVADGEAIALGPGGAPLPFQVTMRRLGRRLDVERLRAELPLAFFLFDCLHRDGETLLDRPTAERVAALEEAVPAGLRVPRRVTGEPAEVDAFWRDALERGHEGLVAKSLDAPYEAGRRGASWLKCKPAHTLDLVVLAAEWGSGRRQGWLSNLHLGARDPEGGGLVMLGKTFKGLTDELLTWQTHRLLELETARDAHAVYVRPLLVVEIAASGVQTSPHYPAGLALRFARVVRYRPDKEAGEADTLEAVRAILAGPGAR